MKSCRLGWHCCHRRQGGEREERRFSVAGVPVLLTPGCFGGLRFALPAGFEPGAAGFDPAAGTRGAFRRLTGAWAVTDRRIERI